MINNKSLSVLIGMFFSLLSTEPVTAQENNNLVKKISAGMEVQWYPAGWIIGPVASYKPAPRHIIHVRAAANITDRHDWGKNEDETGMGYGASLGYRFLITPKKNSFFIGARVDLWAMKIDWKDKINTPQAIKGQTKITIFQPTAEAGYLIRSTNERWNFVFSTSGGKEINIRTKGKAVGEGGIFLLGASVYYAL